MGPPGHPGAAMAAALPLDALLIAARSRRILDEGEAARLRAALAAAPPATVAELDGRLADGATLPAEATQALRRLLPDAATDGDFAPYRPLAHLATGGMGEIWLAADPAGELVVVKTLRADALAADPAVEVEEDGTIWLDAGGGASPSAASPGAPLRRRLEREARITRDLAHPHIVRCRDHGIARSGALFMVLDHHGGGDLLGLIARHGPLPEALALSLGAMVAAALEASHRLHLVHRDIKPGNIFLTSEGAAVLADFGFARSTSANRTHLTLAGSVIGSPSCMPPEQVEGRTDLDIRADLYSLGCVLFHALAGRPPFLGSAAEVMRSHCTAPPPDLAALRPGIQAATAGIVARCLRKDRRERHPDPTALRSELEAALAAAGVAPGTRVPVPAARAEPVPAPPPPPAPPPAPVLPLRPADVGGGLGDWLVLAGADSVVALYARPRLVLGKHRDAAVDLCLRNYPEEAHREACMRISRHHALIAVDSAGGFQVQDLGSANGTWLDGVRLTAAAGIAPGVDHALDIAGVVALRLRALPSPGGTGCAALAIERPANRPGLAYAIVRETLAIGGRGADLVVPGLGPGAAAWIARREGVWAWRAAAGQPWRDLAAGDAIAAGGAGWIARRGDPLGQL